MIGPAAGAIATVDTTRSAEPGDSWGDRVPRADDHGIDQLLAHAVGDYVAQSDWMARNKTKHHLPAAVHSVTYTAAFLPLTRSPRALAVIAGTHFMIDRYRLARHVNWAKNQIAPASYRPGHTATGYAETMPDWMSTWLLIITDNTMHTLVNRWALGRWGGR